jgi:hypothetical protein
MILSKRLITRKVNFNNLFSELGIPKNNESTLFNNVCDIFIKTPYGKNKIEAFHVTEPLSSIQIKLANGRQLRAARNHRIMSCGEWKFLKDLKINDLVAVDGGCSSVKEINFNQKKERMFDLQVNNVHCFYSNGILSHNSLFCSILAANAMRDGKNVVFYTLELDEKTIGKRIDANFSKIPQNELAMYEDVVREAVERDAKGKLYIKYYPTKSASVQTIRSHLNRLAIRNFVPDLAIIDYADIMKGTRHTDQKRLEIESVYEDLRCMAGEMKIPVWTCSQVNRQGSNDEIIELDSVSESFGKAMVSDVILTISRKLKDRMNNTGRIYVAKNRRGKDSQVYPIILDPSCVQCEIFDKLDNDVIERMADKGSGGDHNIAEILNQNGVQQAFKTFQNRKNGSTDNDDDDDDDK